MADAKELVRRYQWFGVGVAIVLAVLAGLVLVAGVLLLGTDLLTGPTFGTERQARDELLRIETPAGSSVGETFTRTDSGSAFAHRSYETSSTCLSDEAGFDDSLLAAGYRERSINDAERQRWERDVEGRLTAYVDLMPGAESPGSTCNLVLGFYEDP